MGHALLSPSSASQWLVCTPSPRLAEKYPDSSSGFADEGTLAHAYAEVHLRYHNDPQGKEEELAKLAFHEHAKHHNEELEQHAIGFAEYVLQQCTGDYILAVEQKLDLTKWVPEGFGTGDGIVVKDGVLNLNDLKYGKGVKVSAVENKQLMIYGLGCIEKYAWMYDFHTIRFHIYQPRLDNISVWSITVEDLLKWAQEELMPKAKLAWEGKGEQVPGEHCRFCKVKAECRALSEFSLQLLKDEFAQPALLTPEEIGELLPKMDTVEIYLKAIREHAYSTLLSGGKIPGFKLVKGRSTRYITDPDSLWTTLNKAGFDDKQITTPPKEPELLGLTALEKVLGKKAFQQYASPFVDKREGKPSLAPETDKRDEFIFMENEFADELKED